jgi:hypothetical protein
MRLVLQYMQREQNEETLRQRMELEEQRRKAEDQGRKEWATGERPSNDREWQLEYTFRQLDNERLSNQAALELKYQLMYSSMTQAARGTWVRSLVLVAIVVAIIAMPIVGIIAGIPAQTFSQFIAPITGIGGTVLGYWFGQHDSADNLGTLSAPKQDTTNPGVTFPEDRRK